MRVAIYARYSSENQSEKNIHDPIKIAQKQIEYYHFSSDRGYIHADPAFHP